MRVAGDPSESPFIHLATVAPGQPAPLRATRLFWLNPSRGKGLRGTFRGSSDENNLRFNRFQADFTKQHVGKSHSWKISSFWAHN